MKSAAGQRSSSSTSLDKENLARLQQLKVFNKTGGLGLASKLLKVKAANEESAAAALSLSKVMARKKGGEALSLQIEIETETQWKLLMRREGLIVVEVYSGWCGPCTSMVSILKKVKVDANDDRLTIAMANSDNISDLKVFKGQSEPAWIFLGSGKPVKLMRGASSAKVVASIKSEFQHELLCIEGKAKRNLISINNEAERKQQAESEAIQLAVIPEAKKSESAKTSTTQSRERTISPEPKSKEDEDDADENDENKKSDSKLGRESPDEGEKIRAEINLRLLRFLESYTVLAVQGFLLETGAVTEIKDTLRKDFNIVQERYIILDDTGVRELFSIPYDIEEPIEEEESEEEPIENLETSEIEGEDHHGLGLDNESTKNETMTPRPNSAVVFGEKGKVDGDDCMGEDATMDEGEREMSDTEIVEKVKVQRFRKVPVPLPDEIEGDTLLFLLESVVLKNKKEENPEEPFDCTADDFIQEKVGPHNFQAALDLQPNCLHALYGKEEHAAGVWCPREYQEKKYVMLNYFPQFVTELLLPPPKECPKYKLAIFPALFSNEIMDHPELLNNAKDVIAQGKMSIPSKLVERILRSRGFNGEDLEAQKKTLTGYSMFAVSVDERNDSLMSAVLSMEPLHVSVDNENGQYETAKLFPYLNILIDNDYDDETYRRDQIVEKFLTRSPKLHLDAILENGCIPNNQVLDENSNDYSSQDTLSTQIT